MAYSTFILAGLAGLLVSLFIWFRKPKASTASLPPGPKPVPVLGNIRDLTAKELWLPAAEWAKQYGKNAKNLDSKRPYDLCQQAMLCTFIYWGRALYF